MTVTLITERPPATRSVPLLTDPDIGHYPEFAAFLAATFDLGQKQLGAPGLLDVDGRIYELIFIGRSGRPFPAGSKSLVPGLDELIFIGRSGRPFPAGVEIAALVPANRWIRVKPTWTCGQSSNG